MDVGVTVEVGVRVGVAVGSKVAVGVVVDVGVAVAVGVGVAVRNGVGVTATLACARGVGGELPPQPASRPARTRIDTIVNVQRTLGIITDIA